MRVAVVGASGNIGLAVTGRLLADPEVDEVVAICRRPPADPLGARVRWVALDVGRPEAAAPLRAAFAGCAAVVHLAWLIQPEHRPDLLARVNVEGSQRVMDAAATAGVEAFVYSSSVGTYAPKPPAGGPVGEDWPNSGVDGSLYSEHKAEVERRLDRFERMNPGIRVVRIRPGFVLSAGAAASQVRYFVGPLLPRPLLRSGRLPVVPWVRGLTLPVVHTRDAAAAFAAAVRRPVRGAYNVATEPVVDRTTVGRLLGARAVVTVPPALVRPAVRLAYRLRLTPASPGLFALALAVPAMATGRARRDLEWAPAVDAAGVLRDSLTGMAAGAGRGTPVLRPAPRLRDQFRGASRALRRRTSPI